jgi:TonB-dependent SusC/RagA subfamily outer membrane receptor
VYAVSGTEPISDFIFEISLGQNDQLTEAAFKAAQTKSKVAKGYKSTRVVVRNEEGEILTENVFGGSDENVFIIKDSEGNTLTEKMRGKEGDSIFIVKGLNGKVVSENILRSEGKNILVVRTGKKHKDSLMVTFSAEFDEDFLIDSEEKIELLVKKAREMKEEAVGLKERIAISEEIEKVLNEEGESLEEAAEEIVSGLWVSKDNGPKKHKVIQIKKLKVDKEQKAAKKQKVAKNQKIIVVKGAANSWTAEGKNQPLIVMDGKIMDKSKNLKEIDPDSIESINVLKGKSAQEKYGDKGANGVIEIVTKKE